jgi:hypothetical protein
MDKQDKELLDLLHGKDVTFPTINKGTEDFQFCNNCNNRMNNRCDIDDHKVYPNDDCIFDYSGQYL